MKRFAFTGCLLVIFSFAFVGESQVSAQKEKDKEKAKAHSIKDIMKLANIGKSSLVSSIAADVKGGDVKWDDVSKKAKELVSLSDELSMAKPKKGDDDSWKKLTGEYHDAAKKLEEAADKKDADAAKTAAGTLQGSCKGCHASHK